MISNYGVSEVAARAGGAVLIGFSHPAYPRTKGQNLAPRLEASLNSKYEIISRFSLLNFHSQISSGRPTNEGHSCVGITPPRLLDLSFSVASPTQQTPTKRKLRLLTLGTARSKSMTKSRRVYNK